MIQGENLSCRGLFNFPCHIARFQGTTIVSADNRIHPTLATDVSDGTRDSRVQRTR